MWWYTVRINFRIFWMVTPMGWGHDLYPCGALSLDLLIKFLTRGWFQTQTNKNAKFTRRVTAVAVLQRSGPVLTFINNTKILHNILSSYIFCFSNAAKTKFPCANLQNVSPQKFGPFLLLDLSICSSVLKS